MKDAPKWQDVATTARGEEFGEDRTTATETVDLVDGQSSPVRSEAQARRPMGRDSAKAAKKKANSDAGSSSSAEYAARMQELSLQRNAIMQEESERRKEPSQFSKLNNIRRQLSYPCVSYIKCFSEVQEFQMDKPIYI
jgi:hypothetical protein